MWFSTTKLAKLEKVTTQTIRRKIDAGIYKKVEKLMVVSTVSVKPIHFYLF